MTALKYQHTPDMGEISDFGGGYEEMCQRMLDAGLRWLEEHPDSDPQFGGFKGVFGLITETNDDARALSEAVLAVCRDCTGAMHQAVIQRCLYVKANGWEKYCAELRASTAGPGENARLRRAASRLPDARRLSSGAWMSGYDPHCVSCGHLRTDHPRDGRCGAALSERCWCQGFAGAAHGVQWNGCFRGTNEDPRECGWCETCGREVYDNDGHGHRRTNNE